MTTVLLVDDEQGVRVLHARYIRRAIPDIQIYVASNGREALDLIEKHPPEFIISDYSMPEMDGYELLKVLKGDSQWKDVPVIIVTGVESMASGELLRRGGADEVFLKPVRPEQLIDAIRRLSSSVSKTVENKPAESGPAAD